eukprot:PRCOL_00004712-RA
MAAPAAVAVDYGDLREKAGEFLTQYQPATAPVDTDPKYRVMMQEVANRSLRAFDVSLEDLEDFCESDTTLIDAVTTNARRMTTIFEQAIEELLPPPSVSGAEIERDTIDVLNEQRKQVQADNEENGEVVPGKAETQLPSALTRRFEVYFVPGSMGKVKALALRDVKSEHIGQLVTVKGIVTRVTDVKPQLAVATYTCDECGAEVFQEITAKTFTPTPKCPSCGTAVPPSLQARGCALVKYQEVKIQEMTEHVPMGSVPRSMMVQLTGERTRTAYPGDEVSITGVYLPVAFSGWKGMRAGLIADTYLHATDVYQHKGQVTAHISEEEAAEGVAALRDDVDRYDKLALSIAPEIYGHEDIKKALLLQMNIALPAALLSRFDLLFLILDRADPELDGMLARHILHVHRKKAAPPLDFEPVNEHAMRDYIAAAQEINPTVPEELADYLAATYANMRREEVDAGAQTATYCTARTLLSILRMSEALARLRFSEVVEQGDVDEALRLVKMSKISLASDEDESQAVDYVSALYRIIRDHAVLKDGAVPYSTCKELAMRSNYAEEQLNETLDIYANLNVWHLGAARDVTLVN